jgi:serine/threonine-protein kinase HipA
MTHSYCKITLNPLSFDSEKKSGYSRAGIRALFGTGTANPVLTMSRSELIQNFKTNKNRMSISGAQPKRSAILTGKTIELTDTGGQYILKPSPEEYPYLAEVEHTCMVLAHQLSSGGRLTIANNGLVELSDGELAYITRRFDRLPDGTKLQQEQMDAVMGITNKYDQNVSYERIGQFIRDIVAVPLPALMAYFEQVLIAYILGNDDFHIRNLGLLVDLNTGKPTGLTPAYDIVASYLYPSDAGFMALPLTIEDEEDQKGETEGIAVYGYYTGGDFLDLGTGIGLSLPVARKIMLRVLASVPAAQELQKRSFMPQNMKVELNNLMNDRAQMLNKMNP